MRCVERNAGWPLTRRKRPMGNDLMCRSVDRFNFALVFDVDVNPARCCVEHAELGTASERDGADYLRGFRVDDSRGIPFVIEDIKFPMLRVKSHHVGILA